MLDRRKGPDALVKWVRWSGIISWILVLIILFITLAAKPGFESYMDKSFHIVLRDTWDADMLLFAFILMILLFLFCIISIFINLRRYKRKSDRLNKAIIINAAAAFAGIVLYLLYRT